MTEQATNTVCPECGAEVAEEDGSCYSCGASLKKKYTGIVPYKNVPALVAYYLGVFSIIPIVGIPLGAAAFVLGIIGIRKRQKNPEVKGTLHAAIGVLGGGFFALLWTGILVVSILSDS